MMYKIIKHNHQFKHNDIIASPSSDSKTYDPCAKKHAILSCNLKTTSAAEIINVLQLASQ